MSHLQLEHEGNSLLSALNFSGSVRGGIITPWLAGWKYLSFLLLVDACVLAVRPPSNTLIPWSLMKFTCSDLPQHECVDSCMVFNQDVFSGPGFLLLQWRGLGIEMQFLQRKIMGVITQTRACVGSNPRLLCDLRQASPLYFSAPRFFVF